MADINNNDIWIDVETLAKLKNITRRAVRLALNQNKYEYRVENIRGGKTYKIKLSTLEEELQLKYFQEYYDDYKTCDNEVIEISNLNIKQEKLISENQRKIALAKYDLIYAWLDFRKEYKRDKLKTSANIPDKEFLQLYNTGMFQEEIFKILGKVSIGSLYRWRALLDYNKDWTALVGQYKYSTRKEYRTTLNEEQIKIFIQILLSPSAFSIGKAISLTKHILKERGQEILPKDITFRRYAEWFRDNNFDKWTLARDGEKALKDKVSPFIVRNATLLKPGQVLVADGHTLNFQVINPFTGKPCRATLLGFLDWKSGGLVGYDIMLEECTQNIASALRNAILKMDHIPEYVYQDNGRAFKSKFFNGDKKFEELGFTGVYNKLGIKPVYATPYNARAKVIERFFLDFQESFEKLIPSYIGTSIENKPAYLMRNEKLHKNIHEKPLFNDDVIEEQFGLKIVLNTAKADELRKISKLNIGGNQKQSQEQMPKTAKISDFGFNISSENIQIDITNYNEHIIAIIKDECETEEENSKIFARKDKFGKIGEYIFCNILSNYYNFNCIIPKVHYITDNNMNVYGIDALFYSEQDNLLLFGESKFCKNLGNGISLINESLKNYQLKH